MVGESLGHCGRGCHGRGGARGYQQFEFSEDAVQSLTGASFQFLLSGPYCIVKGALWQSAALFGRRL